MNKLIKNSINVGKENGMWKGDDVSMDGLHKWIHRRLPKPDLCQNCKKKPPIDLANKGIYNRELKNWWWLCRSCHMELDGRLKRLHKNKKTGWMQKCKYCDNEYWMIPSIWKKGRGRMCSDVCKVKDRKRNKDGRVI